MLSNTNIRGKLHFSINSFIASLLFEGKFCNTKGIFGVIKHILGSRKCRQQGEEF
jgi:hypothetical protein